MKEALRRRPALAAGLIYAVLAIAFVSPALLPGKTLSDSDTLWFYPPWVSSKPAGLTKPSNTDLADASRNLQLFLHGTAEEFPDIPLWNPYIMGGRPWAAYVLPFWTALSWIAVLKLWVAAFGMFLLARALGMRFGGALLAGLVFALNLKMVTWIIYPTMGIWALIPWLLLLTDRFVRRLGLVTGGGLAALVALTFLGGHAETSFHAMLASVLFLALRLGQARRAGATARALARPALGYCAAVAGGLCLAAVSLIPLGELLWLSADVHDRAGQSIDVHLEFKEVIGVFMPDYWGRPTQTSFRPLLLERALYAGALPLMLAGVALVARRSAERIWVALLGAISFAVVIGIPPVVQIVTRLPVFSSGHNTRLIIFWMFAVALLAGWGLDDLAGARRLARPSRRLVMGIAGALVLIPLLYVVVGRRAGLSDVGEAVRVAWLFGNPPGGFLDPQEEGAIRLASLIVWLTLAGAGLVLLGLRLSGRMATSPFVGLALALVCIDLFHAGMGYNPAIDRDYAEQPATGAIRYLQRQNPARFVSTEEIPINVIPMRFGLYEARGYDLPIVRRFDRIWRSQVTPTAGTVAAGLVDVPLRFPAPTPSALRLMRLLGVTHILHAQTVLPARPPLDRLAPFPPLRARGLRLVYDGADARVYRVVGALPRAFVVPVQRVVSGGDEALAAVTAPGFDGRRVAVTEGRVAGVPVSGSGVGSVGRVVCYEPERVVVRASGSGLLVLSDNWFPGWRASVDGREVPVERVDYLFRGVRLGPGEHTVEFRYRPLSWRLGWIVSLVSLAVLALALIAGTRRRNTTTAP
jgi:Bacterial membrane protein YfhO